MKNKEKIALLEGRIERLEKQLHIPWDKTVGSVLAEITSAGDMARAELRAETVGSILKKREEEADDLLHDAMEGNWQ